MHIWMVAVFLVISLGTGCGGSPPASPDMVDAGPDTGPDADVNVGPTDEYIFDQALFHHFELEVAPDDWQWLRDNALREEYVPATLVFEDRRYEGAAVRFKGAYNTLEQCFDDDEQVCPKLSIKVSMNEYGPGRFAGLRKLVFNSSITDDTLMREVLAYRMFRQMGVPAPRASHAQLTVNGEWQGVFVLVENIDKEFIEEHWARDQGNLYKIVWPQHDTADEYIENLHTNETSPDVSRMLAFKSLLDATSDQTFVTDMAGTVDLASMARFLAVDRAINNRDGPRRFYCFDRDEDWLECTNNNYFWYEEPGGPFHLIPWDLDFALRHASTDLDRSMWSTDCTRIPDCDSDDPDCAETADTAIMPTQCDPLLGHVHRATWNNYLSALARLASGPLSEAEVTTFLTAQRDKIRDAVAQDPFGPGASEWQEENNFLDETLAHQRAEIARLLAEPQP